MPRQWIVERDLVTLKWDRTTQRYEPMARRRVQCRVSLKRLVIVDLSETAKITTPATFTLDGIPVRQESVRDHYHYRLEIPKQEVANA